MIIKGLIDEDFVQYKKPSMTIMFPSCSFKCDIECGESVCQNSTLASSKNIVVSVDKIVKRYLDNDITNALVCGGLEPMDSFDDLMCLITKFREFTNDDIVIFTGYEKKEIYARLEQLKQYKNIIIKFGRFKPYNNKHYDEILGVYLASDNQYTEVIS